MFSSVGASSKPGAVHNAYPKLIKMTPEELRQFNIVNAFAKPDEMWGVPIEIDHNTTGVMIAVDGTEMPLAEGY
ncbi:hypothetical protein [Comamonas testosteroni]|uniref:hypothetical protein n=1 Tax=Comamonas testosteroni TaxID=285 RepID=UPI0028E892D6|nr:hypothetical protein [Comamonas testosteroni]